MSEGDSAIAGLDTGKEEDRLEIAKQLYRKFCYYLIDNPDRAKTQLIAGIQIVLKRAYDHKVVYPPMQE